MKTKKCLKALGNLYTLDDLIAKNHTPMALRYTLIASSYRQPLNFTFDGLRASESALNKIERFTEALLHNINQSKEQFNEQYVCTHQLKDFGLLQNAWEGLSNNPQYLCLLRITLWFNWIKSCK